MTDAKGRTLGASLPLALKSCGVDVVFGIPGVHNVEMYRGIQEAGIAHVLARHEQGAGFMADGYARACGKPGVAFVITGPGLTNIMTPMGQAWSDSVPMLVISSCLAETGAVQGQLHQMRDQEGAAATVCAWSETARTPEATYQLLERAFLEFRVSRPRPRHLSVPIPALEAEAPPPPAPRRQPREMDGGRAGDVAFVADLLRKAARPLIIVGGGAKRAVLFDLMAKSGAAAFTTFAGRGILGAAHPMNFGAMLARPGAAGVLASADLVLAIGTELAEVDLWRAQLGHDCPMVRVDIDPVVLGDRQRAEYPVLADAYWFVDALATALEGHVARTTWKPDEIAATRARWRAEIDAERPGILPVVDALRQALPPETMIFSDMTQFAYAAKEVWEMPAPGLWHHPTGFGTLGYALPAAIGGKVAVGSERPVVAIAGDYGLHYTLQELGTAAELGQALPIILWDNGKLKEIEECMVESQIAPNAVVARNPDFEKLADAFGIAYARPRGLADIGPALQRALSASGPTLVHLTPQISSSN